MYQRSESDGTHFLDVILDIALLPECNASWLRWYKHQTPNGVILLHSAISQEPFVPDKDFASLIRSVIAWPTSESPGTLLKTFCHSVIARL